MIGRTLLPALLLLIATSAGAMDRTAADSLTARADRAYSTGDHAIALQLYDSVLTAYTSAGLHYNIGNCHFKLQDIPRAILHYERALKLSPGDEDIRNNLELARQQIVDRVNEMPRASLGNTVGRFFGGSDLDQWAWRSVWIWCITILLLIGAWISARPALRRSLLAIAAICLLATAISVLFGVAAHRHLNANDEAILLAPVVDVRSEPAATATTLFVIHKGIKVNVLQQSGDWAEISLLNGNVGWVPVETFERI